MKEVSVVFNQIELEVLISLAGQGLMTVDRTRHVSSQLYIMRGQAMVIKLKRNLQLIKDSKSKKLRERYSLDNIKKIK